MQATRKSANAHTYVPRFAAYDCHFRPGQLLCSSDLGGGVVRIGPCGVCHLRRGHDIHLPSHHNTSHTHVISPLVIFNVIDINIIMIVFIVVIVDFITLVFSSYL
jgi:hypothetical protein